MRKLLGLIMMLVMLTPSLACAMPVCADGTHAAATAPPCAEHASQQSKENDDAGGINLLKDCMGVDLQAAGSVFVKKPALQTDLLFTAIAGQPSFPARELVEAVGLRGPPPDWPDVSRLQPSVILTTQRFRI